jgi:hypothetical protein
MLVQEGAKYRPTIDVWRMILRRASDAGIETAIGCHTFPGESAPLK